MRTYYVYFHGTYDSMPSSVYITAKDVNSLRKILITDYFSKNDKIRSAIVWNSNNRSAGVMWPHPAYKYLWAIGGNAIKRGPSHPVDVNTGKLINENKTKDKKKTVPFVKQ